MIRSHRKLFIALSIAAILLFCVFPGLFLHSLFQSIDESLRAFGTYTCAPSTPKNTEDLAQFEFPPSMHNLSSTCFGMQGWGGFARFEMSPSDLDFFVSHLQIKPPLISGGVPGDNDLATKASTLKSFLHGSYHTAYKNGHTFDQDVLIDIADPTNYVVYVNFGGG